MNIQPAAKHILSLTIEKLDRCQTLTCKILLYDRKLICLKILNQCWNTIQLCYSSLAGPLQSVCFLCWTSIPPISTKWTIINLTKLTEHTMTCDVGNPSLGLGQAHKCGRVKPFNGITTLFPYTIQFAYLYTPHKIVWGHIVFRFVCSFVRPALLCKCSSS